MKILLGFLPGRNLERCAHRRHSAGNRNMSASAPGAALGEQEKMGPDFATHRNAFREHERIRSLMDLIPKGRISVLDAGARDGHLSILLADHFEIVTALDHKKSPVPHLKV